MDSDNPSQAPLMQGEKRPVFDAASDRAHALQKKMRVSETEKSEWPAEHAQTRCLTDFDTGVYAAHRATQVPQRPPGVGGTIQYDHQKQITPADEVDLCKCIEVNKFSSVHLPERYQGDSTLTDHVRAQADLTCLIKVQQVSPDRPETYSGRGKSFPLNKYRGREDIVRTGTGWVSQVRVYTEEDKDIWWYRTCPCQVCQSRDAKSAWAKVWITTGNHVVFDKSEADACKCYLFYDSGQQKLTDCPVISGEVTWVKNDRFENISKIEYITHDVALARRLDAMLDHYDSLCTALIRSYGVSREVVTDRANTKRKLLSDKITYNPDADDEGVEVNLSHSDILDTENNNEKYLDDEETSDCDDCFVEYNPEHSLAIITSHPHGCAKTVILCQVRHRGQVSDERDDTLRKYQYPHLTCPGSSGAPVFLLGRGYGLNLHPHIE